MITSADIQGNIAHAKSVQTNNAYMITREPMEDCFGFKGPVGALLGQAPCLDQGLFKGRSSELHQMEEILKPYDEISRQQKMVLGGLGGIGKTQLAIEYAKTHQNTHESIFWLNAESEATLKATFRSMARHIFNAKDLAALDDQNLLTYIDQWLSDIRNRRWLLIFDNYDDPDQFDIGRYYPMASHGSVIITTRRPEHFGVFIKIEPIKNIEDNLDILRTRSGRDICNSNSDANNLVKRFKGLPLAIAFAGAYLKRSTLTFKNLLQQYDKHRNIEQFRPIRLPEYQGRTLYTTWDLSYKHLEKNHPNAAELLKLLAYFSYQRFWYELFRAGVGEEHPAQLQEMLTDEMQFDSAMGILADYCFLETQPELKSWSMHTCVHDWILAKLNKEANPKPYWYAFDCVAKSINPGDCEAFGYLSYSHLASHAAWLVQQPFNQKSPMYEITSDRFFEAWGIASLLYRQLQLKEAKKMLKRALAGIQSRLGPDHNYTLVTIQSIGKVYSKQENLEKAEQMFHQALEMGIKRPGPYHLSTLYEAQERAGVQNKQGNLKEAEQMLQQVLGINERRLGPDCLLAEYAAQELAEDYRKQENRTQSRFMSITWQE